MRREQIFPEYRSPHSVWVVIVPRRTAQHAAGPPAPPLQPSISGPSAVRPPKALTIDTMQRPRYSGVAFLHAEPEHNGAPRIVVRELASRRSTIIELLDSTTGADSPGSQREDAPTNSALYVSNFATVPEGGVPPTT